MAKYKVPYHLIGWGLLLLAFLCFSCRTAKQPPVTTAIGTVISVDGDNVLIAFQVINKDKGAQGSNWFYCPQHQFQVGDKYPDPSKYKP
ncbi:hypothetical protein PBT90_00065 [Algoriphagus halophytocola]|uniref:hypothetical protein n=1 Tax=Algoriphagus halophytocola TaxID=2991499 RepID=UPI0022DE62D7|nr:hypothetical protein [Algoriphagus sp. TR-M9]WBL42361.1 hypothetical protein PBT90_16620 [Algoriphagus sp. TR-M9]WBL43102.1 hypothetical protein PBT90_00065 [Algoriphagus sp. TR-M9]